MMRMTQIIFLIFFCNACHGTSPSNSELMDCWIESYKSDFQFVEQLENLEEQLLFNHIIQENNLSDYRSLFEKFGEKNDFFLENISVEKYVNETKFKECISISDLANEDERTLKYGLLFSIYHILSKDKVKIFVTVKNNEKLSINDKPILLEDFFDEMELAKDHLTKRGIPVEDIIISLAVGAEVKIGIISNIQLHLRDLKIRKVDYSVSD